MDAVEFSYPADVAAPKLMGSEGLAGVGVTVKKVEVCESDRVSVLTSSSIDLCSSYVCRKDVTNTDKNVESVSRDKIPDTEVLLNGRELRGDNAFECHDGRGKNGLLCTSRPEIQLQRKTGKLSRTGSICPKRSHVVQLEDPLSLSVDDEVNDTSVKLGSNPKKCTSPENAQPVKQKNNLNGKRSDKRNFKVSVKSKYDSFSIKAGSGGLYPATPTGSNFFGVYGLKSDIKDISEFVKDVPLSDLLCGACECPSLGTDRGEKGAGTNESFLLSVRNACSILQLPRRVQSQNSAETDSFCIKKLSTNLSSSVSIMAGGVNGDNGENCLMDLSSCNKMQESCSKSETSNPLDLLLHKPNDIFERLAFPPPKDLDSLLQDATKPSLSSRNGSDLRSVKQLSRRTSLQPFQWSHAFNANCKSNSDSAKLSASKSPCPGRWSRIRNSAISQGITTNCSINLGSITFNQSLVPSRLRTTSSVDKIPLSISVNHPQFRWDSLSSVTSLKASLVSVASGGKVNYEGGHCPRVLAAAQTLCDIATTRSSRQTIDGILRWPKRPSQKSMKTRKLKSNEKPKEMIAAPSSGLGSDSVARHAGQLLPSKKPRLSTADQNKKELGQSNCRKGTINWSAPRSSRSSPSKVARDSIPETKYLTATAGNVKPSCMMPPPQTLVDKACDSQQKTRKYLPMEWRRGKERVLD